MSPLHPKHHAPRLHHIGKWMPSSTEDHHTWLGGVIAHVDSKTIHDLHPVLREFQDLIEKNTRVYLLVSAMFSEIPRNRSYSKDPTGCPQIRDYQHLLRVLNYLITTAPSWSDFSHRVGLVGLPINAVLDWPMGTPSGYAAFLDPEINRMIKKFLNAWGDFLKSGESASVLDDSQYGWFGPTAQQDLLAVANNDGLTNYKAFDEMYECEPQAKHHGFKSWDDFFTRLFRPGVRPVAEPDNDNVIANACESTPFKVARGVKARDMFWLKKQPYSVLDMLAHDDLAHHFAGGTVYQAFLSALSYHRWHAPVSGIIKKAYVAEGTYYAEPLFEGLGDVDIKTHRDHYGIDANGQVTAQEFNTATATRAVIFIEADNPAIGLMVFLGVGMCEVSTCNITVKEGQHVKKGDQTGMFHFGGSTHCLMFRKGVNVEEFPSTNLGRNVPVNSKVGVVRS